MVWPSSTVTLPGGKSSGRRTGTRSVKLAVRPLRSISAVSRISGRDDNTAGEARRVAVSGA